MKPRKAITDRIEDVLLGPVRLQALYVAVRLGIPDMVRDGPRSSTLLASSAGVHPEALHRLMRFLVADGVFSVGEGGRFGSTPLSDALTMGAPGGYREQILNTAMRTWDAWRDVLYAVETGQPSFERVHGETFRADQLRNGAWLARENAPQVAAAATLLTAQLAGPDAVIVGSGAAAMGAALLATSPGLKVVVCDAPAARDWSIETLAEHAGRACFEPFDGGAVPAGRGAYALVRVLREMDDVAAGDLLERVHAGMPPGGAVAVIEQVTPAEKPVGRELSLADLELLITSGGKERSLVEYRALLQRAGFRFETTVTGSGTPLTAIIGTKGLL